MYPVVFQSLKGKMRPENEELDIENLTEEQIDSLTRGGGYDEAIDFLEEVGKTARDALESLPPSLRPSGPFKPVETIDEVFEIMKNISETYKASVAFHEREGPKIDALIQKYSKPDPTSPEEYPSAGVSSDSEDSLEVLEVIPSTKPILAVEDEEDDLELIGEIPAEKGTKRSRDTSSSSETPVPKRARMEIEWMDADKLRKEDGRMVTDQVIRLPADKKKNLPLTIITTFNSDRDLLSYLTCAATAARVTATGKRIPSKARTLLMDSFGNRVGADGHVASVWVPRFSERLRKGESPDGLPSNYRRGARPDMSLHPSLGGYSQNARTMRGMSLYGTARFEPIGGAREAFVRAANLSFLFSFSSFAGEGFQEPNEAFLPLFNKCFLHRRRRDSERKKSPPNHPPPRRQGAWRRPHRSWSPPRREPPGQHRRSFHQRSSRPGIPPGSANLQPLGPPRLEMNPRRTVLPPSRPRRSPSPQRRSYHNHDRR